MSWIDNALSIDSQVLLLRAKRAEVLAANLANADTPGYKARDVSFDSILEDVRAGRGTTTNKAQGHFDLNALSSAAIFERSSGKESANGNTVSREFEQSAFSKNSVQYLASLRFLSGNVQGLMKALRGE
jgi:flagellar basal-body rod protein FlgB